MPTVTAISPREAKALWEGGEPVLFVDCRNPQAWAESTVKLPGAIRLPKGEFQEHLAEIPRDVTAITYCT